MATGTYGIIRPADASPTDMSVFYTYTPDRTEQPEEIKELNSTGVISKFDDPNDAGKIFEGLYNLNLSTSIFNKKGHYTIMIRPKAIRLNITDCGVLASNDTIRGIVFNLQDVPSQEVSKFENGGLSGYRVEFINIDPNVDEKKIQNKHIEITSNNKVEPISENLTNSTQKGLKYRLNDNSTLVFCTVTPSSASEVKPNAQPYIGLPNQEVIIYNTFFDPITINVNLVEHDFDTIANLVAGDRTKAVQEGIETIYNEDGNIYKQFNVGDIKDSTSTESLYEFRVERDDIDFTQNKDEIINT